jgi:hypothetical protein
VATFQVAMTRACGFSRTRLQPRFPPACQTKRRADLFNPKTEIEPQPERSGDSRRQITRIDTDYEKVVETIFKPVWCILKSVKSV